MKVKHDSRICFGIDYYDDEAEAEAEGAKVTAAGETYNGGWYHGMACGRDHYKDYTDDEGRKLYAVTRQ